jgi:hypothetical protein
MNMGDYLFKKGDKPDYAYVILYGMVIFLNVKSTTYLQGQEPQSPAEHDRKSQAAPAGLNPE